MTDFFDHLVRNSDNQVKRTLTQGGIPIVGVWTSLEVFIGGVKLTRAADGNGLALSTTTGELVITPADLLAQEIIDLDALAEDFYHDALVTVFSVANNDGAVFGDADSADRWFFTVGDKPV